LNPTPSIPAALTEPGLTNGYGPRPIPDPLDGELYAFARSIAEPDGFAAARAQLAAADAAQPSRILAVFGERMASLAVRDADLGVLRAGLTGTALACAVTEDGREQVTAMVLLYRAAELIGADPDDEFAAAGRASGDPHAQEALLAFTRRPADARSLAAMYYVEAQDADGFRFVFEDR
jgi:hypothetical protein